MSKSDMEKELDGLSKDLGVDIVSFGAGSGKSQIEAQSTGSPTLDAALGVGGLPKGRIVELYGPEAGGKTSISLLTAAQVIKGGGKVLFIDAENALSPDWARKLGVDLDTLPIVQENCAEKVFNVLEKALDSGKFNLIVIDSVTSLAPQKEIEGAMEDQTIGLQARIISKGLRKVVGKVAKSKCIVIFINQLREKIGILFGNPETTPGGRALKFYASIRLRVSRDGKVVTDKDSKEKTGFLTKVRVEKNKVAAPYREASLYLDFEHGLDRATEVFAVAVDKGVINRSGPTYTFQKHSWRGQDAVKDALRTDQSLYDELVAAISVSVNTVTAPAVSEVE